MVRPPSASNVRAPRWAWLVATGFGSGYLRPASGTWGSAAGLLAWLLLTFLWATPLTTWMRTQVVGSVSLGVLAAGEAWFLVLPVLMTALAVRASDLVVRETGEKDPGYIVADEWAGMWIALWPLRWLLAKEGFRLFSPGGWRWLALLALPFLAFRLFDIWKPWPARQIQDLPGGEGIVADDVVAGLYALVLTDVCTRFVLTWIQG